MRFPIKIFVNHHPQVFIRVAGFQRNIVNFNRQFGNTFFICNNSIIIASFNSLPGNKTKLTITLSCHDVSSVCRVIDFQHSFDPFDLSSKIYPKSEIIPSNPINSKCDYKSNLEIFMFVLFLIPPELKQKTNVRLCTKRLKHHTYYLLIKLKEL